MKINEISSIDAGSVWEDLQERFGKTDSAFQKISQDYDFKSEDPVAQQFVTFFKNFDRKNFSSLLKTFQYMNSKESHLYGYGAYLSGDLG
jgi:hypothetical protein